MGERKILVLSLAAGLAAAALAFLYLQGERRKYVAFAETKPVVVARRYIPAWSRVDETMVEVAQAPGNALQPGAFADPARAVGQLALAPMVAGEQLLSTKLAAAGGQLSAYIPKGMRGITLSLDHLSTHAGLLRPGDAVDVLSTFDMSQGGKALAVAGTLLQDLRVAAVGARFTNEDGEPSGGSDSVTLVVTPEEAELLLFAEERGKLRLALRAPGDAARTHRKVVSFKAVVDNLMAGEAKPNEP